MLSKTTQQHFKQCFTLDAPSHQQKYWNFSWFQKSTNKWFNRNELYKQSTYIDKTRLEWGARAAQGREIFWGAWREEEWNSNIALIVTFSFKHFQMPWEKCMYLKYNINLFGCSSQPGVKAFPQERAGALYTGAASPKPWHGWNTQQLLEWSQQGKNSLSQTPISA